MIRQIIAVQTAVKAKIVMGRKTNWRIAHSPEIESPFSIRPVCRANAAISPASQGETI